MMTIAKSKPHINKLFPLQGQIIRLLISKVGKITELLIGGGAGGAKSTTGCIWLINMCIQYPGTRWLMGRSELSALKITTYKTFLDVAKKQYLLTYGRDFVLKPNNVIVFSNGSEVVLMDMKYYPNKDPDYDKLGSLELTGGFLDEVAQIPRKGYEVASTRVGRYKNDEYGIPGILLMSCNPTKGRVYKDFYKKQRDGVIESHKKFIQVLAKNNPFIPKAYLNKLANMDEGAMKQRLYYGNREYDDTPGILIQYQKMLEMFARKDASNGEKYLIIDVARHGVDRSTCIYWEGYQGYVLWEEEKSDMDKLEERIRDEATKRGVRISTNVIVDEDGIGGGLVDNLGCVGFVANSSVIPNEETGEKPNFMNLKTQCGFALAKFINDGKIGLDCPKELQDGICDELNTIREVGLDDDKKRRIMQKKDVKLELGRSPDWSDNLLMRMLPELDKIPDYSFALNKK